MGSWLNWVAKVEEKPDMFLVAVGDGAVAVAISQVRLVFLCGL
jgi:hypothetical protein